QDAAWETPGTSRSARTSYGFLRRHEHVTTLSGPHRGLDRGHVFVTVTKRGRPGASRPLRPRAFGRRPQPAGAASETPGPRSPIDSGPNHAAPGRPGPRTSPSPG